MGRPIIEVQNLSKRYRLGNGHSFGGFQTLRDKLASCFKTSNSGKTDIKDFWALSGVSFEVQTGEVLGIIGANGAGKSTLLKILSRITEPTEGEVVLRGRVASLLEVGTGFHPELTGRENIYLNGVILGMKRREVTRKLDEIIDFSGVQKFLDTPVKRYSSGMYVRLAFAVAAHLDPEILIVDEVLAVGDAEFQEKCLGAMSRLGREGRTVLFVSHNMTAISKLTTRCLVLSEGKCVFSGPSHQAVEAYSARNGGLGGGTCELASQPRPSWVGDRSIELRRASLHGVASGRLKSGGDFQFTVEIKSNVNVSSAVLEIKLNTRDGSPLGTAFSQDIGPLVQGADYRFDAEICDPGMSPGRYSCSFVLVVGGRTPVDAVLDVMRFDFEAPDRFPMAHHTWNPDWGSLRLSMQNRVSRLAH